MLMLSLTGGAAFSQIARKPFHDPRAGSTAPAANNKIASHLDLPELLYGFEWNNLASAWDSMEIVTYTYHPNGDFAEAIYDRYDGVTFMHDSRQTNTYAGQTIRTTSEIWTGSAWENSSKFETTDDNFGNTLLNIYCSWNINQWDTLAGDRVSYQYNLANQVVESVIESWNQNTHQWDTGYLEQYAWSNPTGWDTVTYSNWNGSGWELAERFVDVTWYDFANFLPYYARNQVYNAPLWEDVERFTATYGTNGSGTTYSEDWNGATWDSVYKDVVINDSHGHQVSYEGYQWNASWMLNSVSLTQYTYDLQDRTIEEVYQSGNPSPVENYYRIVYPSFFTSAIGAHSITSNVTAYPNPCTDRLNFKVENSQNGPIQISIYDLQGRLRMQTVTAAAVGKDITLSISELLENGSYVYRIATKDAQASGKVVVQR